MNSAYQIRALINRLARLDAAETWEVDLNPAQLAALDYLVRANRFSRAPSQVAEYLGTTRGTMSQTLKSLVRKGYLTERGSESDRRSISYTFRKPRCDARCPHRGEQRTRVRHLQDLYASPYEQ
jgi:DNA-binding MarR family transcriptional regulator